MDYVRLGAAIRAVRIRLDLRQADVAAKAAVSQATQSRIELGDCGGVTLDTLEGVARVLGMRLDLIARWRGMDLPRLLDRDHAALAEAVIRGLAAVGGWEFAPEVTFSVYGERGSIDLLAWHAATRTLLVVELKTAIVDLQDGLSTIDRKRRLAASLVRDRGWRPLHIAVWLAVADTRTNRRHVEGHADLLGAAFPQRGRAVAAWLARPTGAMSRPLVLQVSGTSDCTVRSSPGVEAEAFRRADLSLGSVRHPPHGLWSGAACTDDEISNSFTLDQGSRSSAGRVLVKADGARFRPVPSPRVSDQRTAARRSATGVSSRDTRSSRGRPSRRSGTRRGHSGPGSRSPACCRSLGAAHRPGC